MNQLTRLKSAPPRRRLAPTIAALLNNTRLGISPGAVTNLAETIQTDLHAGYQELLGIDQEIGGVGLHNVNRQDGQWVTGNYRVELRPLFRPIQYVFTWLCQDDLIWNSRRIVQDSCLHIEYAVKFLFHIRDDMNASLGVLLNLPPVVQGLDPAFRGLMLGLNRTVYRAAKHSVEEIKIDAHRFTPAEALAVYLTCRWAGVRLLEPMGLFDDWKRTT